MADEDWVTQTLIKNAEGKVKAKVIKVLELEIEQMKDFLDRPIPNVKEALVSVDHLEKLLTELKPK